MNASIPAIAIAIAIGVPASAGDAPRLAARAHDSGFELSHDTYNGMGAASDGRIYYVLSSESAEVGGQMFCYDPASDKVRRVGDITEACGEKGKKTVAQGKSHVNFVEWKGKLYFATHVGHYSIIDGMEKIGIPPEGWGPYPGGHFLSYDMKAEKFEDLGIAPRGEGILSMTMDGPRGKLYGLTWPTGNFLRLDLATKELKDLGTTCREGENGKGDRYRTICRSLVVDPRDGACYFTDGDGDIYRYVVNQDAIEKVEGDDVNMRKDYFGQYDPTSPGHMGYNWRQTVWSEADKCIYGVHGNSGYLFRFVPDPKAPKVEVLERLTSRPSKRSGMFDQFSYGYLGFTLGPDGRTIYYLTGGPIYIDGKRVTGKGKTAMGEAKGLEDLHVITYDTRSGTYRDNGAVYLEDGGRPTYVNSIAIGRDGAVYTLGRVKRGEKVMGDLIKIPMRRGGRSG